MRHGLVCIRSWLQIQFLFRFPDARALNAICHIYIYIYIQYDYKHGTVGASPAARVHLLSRGIVCVFLFHFSLHVLDNLFEG